MSNETTYLDVMARVYQADGLTAKITGDANMIVMLRFPPRSDDGHIEFISAIMTYDQAQLVIDHFDPDGSIRERSMKNVDLALYK